MAADSFIPRPFPPPSLANVPLEYIISQLHRLALHYWDKPETADCTVFVPIIPSARGRPTRHARPSTPLSPAPMSPHFPTTNDPAGLGRRATEPTLTRVTRITSKLHIDYLSSQSTLFQTLFSGSSTLDPATNPSHRPAIAPPASRLPRLMPSSPTHPVVYLPLPDPASFPHLMHYMYFGQTTYIEECLNRKVIQWEGVVRNVEYLGMRTEIKVFLGRWYGNWMAPAHLRVGRLPICVLEDCQSDDDDEDFDASDDDYDEESVPFDDDDDEESEPFDEPQRGRPRTRRCTMAPDPPCPTLGIRSL